MIVEVHLLTTAEPIKYGRALNAYTKGSMYCVYYEDTDYRDPPGSVAVKSKVDKYPLCNIFRVRESYK